MCDSCVSKFQTERLGGNASQRTSILCFLSRLFTNILVIQTKDYTHLLCCYRCQHLLCSYRCQHLLCSYRCQHLLCCYRCQHLLCCYRCQHFPIIRCSPFYPVDIKNVDSYAEYATVNGASAYSYACSSVFIIFVIVVSYYCCRCGYCYSNFLIFFVFSIFPCVCFIILH
jgi:hypothetical protein